MGMEIEVEMEMEMGIFAERSGDGYDYGDDDIFQKTMPILLRIYHISLLV